VVWGGYGYGNTGDDLVLAVALAELRRRHGNNLQVLSPAPTQTRPCAPAVEVILHPSDRPRRAFERWFWRWTDYAETGGMKPLADALYRVALKHPARFCDESGWLAALAAASTLHLAGGGYLADRFDLRHFLRPLRIARSRRLPVTTSPLGLGPFRNARKAAAVVAALRDSQLVVRDENSLQFCRDYSLAAVEMPDDGFKFRQVIDLPASAPAPSETRTIGVCIFSQYSRAWSERVETWWVDCLQALARTSPESQLEGFCFHTNRQMDYDTTRRLFVRAGLSPDTVRPPQADYRAAIADLRRYQAIVSTRFHAVVAASAMAIPCLAVVLDDYYLAKMRGALKHAPAPVSLLNPLVDSAPASAQWLDSTFSGSPLVSGSQAPGETRHR